MTRATTLAALLLLTAGFAAAEMSVDEIVHKTNYVSYYQGKTGRADVKMTIVDDRDRKRNREFSILRWDAPRPEGQEAQTDNAKKDDEYTGEQKFYLYFHRPADVNKMAFLVHKHLDKDDDRWLYMPALDLVKRIAATDKRTSFVGSHFFYEDVSGRHIDADKHELVETTGTYYVLKNTPKDRDAVEFDYFKMWIHKKTFIPVQTSYYKNGKEYRRYKVLGVKKIDGFLTVVKSRMSDLESGGHTDLEYADVDYNTGLDEDLFTERRLRKPPREVVR